MTFDEVIEWLYSTQNRGIKLGLDNIRFLLSLLGSPEKKLQFLHVAGTNGKGSVCAFLDAILRVQGYQTGLFTSPHLIEFPERIRINGVAIPKKDVTAGLALLKNLVERMSTIPTFFELATALALWYFSRQGAQLIIWETGMGGRWDATNIVVPLVSIITSISFDHKEWLGDTLEKIAYEKAGIIKCGVPVVSVPQPAEVARELCRVAAEQFAPIRFVEKAWDAPAVGLRGAHQCWNAALAVEALRSANIPVSTASIFRGLREVQWFGRFQVSGQLVLDGAHNPDSTRALVDTWKEAFGNQKASIVFGSLRGKASEEMLPLLASIAAKFLFVPVQNDRTKCPAEHQSPTEIPSEYFSSAREAVNTALADQDLVLVTGSLFLVGEVLARQCGISYQKTDQ